MNSAKDTIKAHCVYSKFGKQDSVKLSFPDHYLAYGAEGSMRLEIDSRYFFLQPTKAVWIPAEVEVLAQIPVGVTCCSVLFDPAFFPAGNLDVQTIDLTPLAQQMILHCRRWDTRDKAANNEASTFFSALASIILERMDAPTTDWVPRGKSELVSKAVDLTMERFMMPIELKTLATDLATSERTLSRRVVNETGMKWGQLLRRIRIVRARELLSTTELPITRVAADVGYASQSAFNRAFKEDTSQTPRDFLAYLNREKIPDS